MELPVEMWAAVLRHCAPRDRRSVRRVSRTLCAVSDAFDETLFRLRYGVPPSVTKRIAECRQAVAFNFTGALEQWCSAATSVSVLALSVCMHVPLTVAPGQEYTYLHTMLPPSLRTLELNVRSSSLGSLGVQSLCASLTRARSLDSLVLTAVCVDDLLHLVGALDKRAADPFNAPLRHIDVTVTTGYGSVERPSCVALGGLVAVDRLAVVVCPAVTPDDKAIVAHLVDQWCALSSRGAVRSFRYFGQPLANAAAWASVMHRSVDTLVDVVVPPFVPGAKTIEVETAIDSARQLQQLEVQWPEARLDFMLCNKPALERVVHWGVVYDWAQLVQQMVVLPSVAHFHTLVAAPVGVSEALAQWTPGRTVRLGAGTRVNFGTT